MFTVVQQRYIKFERYYILLKQLTQESFLNMSKKREFPVTKIKVAGKGENKRQRGK